MAIYNKTIIGGNGISYTKETDSSSDWASIDNNTYFRDIADGLIHYKNSEGNILEIFSAAITLSQADTIYIDSVSGINAATGRGDINKPYLTVEYALSNTTNTGTIIGNTATNYTISGISDANNANLKVGQNIGGTGITYDTVIVAKGNQGSNANTITLSKPTTATSTGVTITWVSSYSLILSGNFVATSNWYKQGMYIDAQTSTIAWGAFTLFNNTATQIMPYTLLGNGRYSQTTATTSRFFYFAATQTSDFSINLNYETIHTVDTNPIFYISTADGRSILRGVLAKALFGSIAHVNTSKLTVYSSTYGLIGGITSDNIAVINLNGGVHQTPSSIYIIGGSISFFNSNCTLYGSVSGSFWNHVGTLSGTTLTCSAGNIMASGSGTFNMSGGTISLVNGNLGSFDVTINGTVTNNGQIRHLVLTSGTLINNGYIYGDSPSISGTLINNGTINWDNNNSFTLSVNSSIQNYSNILIARFAIAGGTLENRGNINFNYAGNAITISSGTLRNFGKIKNISKSIDMLTLSSTGIIENYGEIQNTIVSTSFSIIKKSGGTLKLYPGSILKVANGLSPIWCVNNDSASKDIYLFNCITNCNGTSYGLGYAFPTGFVPNDLVGGIKYENVNY